MKHVKAVIFDWAGTVVDYGSLAPMGAFVETFEQFGVSITIDEARGPMGMAKRPHIAALMALPRVAQAWRSEDIRIGTTTGYTREIMAEITPGAAAQGFSPDSLVCTGDTPEGRPSPYMIYKTLPQLGVWLAKNAIKVDDTEVGIEEGINGGTWAVGVAVSGNAFGMAEADVKALPVDEFARLRAAAARKLSAAGAHYVVDSVADLMPVVYDIEARLARGERP
jgi:phosphonoacetaldehyde hydrolase